MTIELDGFDNLKYDDALAEKGKPFHYGDKANPLTIHSKMIGVNKAFAEARSELAEKQNQAAAIGMEWSSEARDRGFLGIVFDTCVTGWSGFKSGGEELPFTRENWLDVMSEPKVGRKLFNLFFADASASGEFLPSKDTSAAGNSEAPSSGT